MFRRKRVTQKRRKTPKRLRERWTFRIAESAICLALLAAYAYGVYDYMRRTPLLRVRTIRVEGADQLQEDSIIAKSRITADDNILFLDPAAVRGHVQEIPSVRACSVKRFFPAKVVIGIDERMALASLLVNNRLFEIDEECNILRELPVDKPPVGPFITNVSDLGYVEPGQQLSHKGLGHALSVWRAFSRTAMAREVTVSEISAANDNRICMYCDEFKFEIRWGRDAFDHQARKLDVFWKKCPRPLDCKEYIDLRFGDDVACK